MQFSCEHHDIILTKVTDEESERERAVNIIIIGIPLKVLIVDQVRG